MPSATEHAGLADNPYTLALSEGEIRRYRKMAQEASSQERAALVAAGFVPGAHVADVGCGPGLFLAELARLVGPTGSIVGVEANAEARAAARATVAGEGLTNATIVEGDAGATGLEPGRLDAIMMRHVLVHNGARLLGDDVGEVELGLCTLGAGLRTPVDPRKRPHL